MLPFLLTGGSAAIMVGLLVPFGGALLLYLSLPFLWFFILVVNWLGEFGFVFSVHNLPWEIWVGYYFLLGAWVWMKKSQLELRGAYQRESSGD
jgi:hypothetical protein